MPAESGTHDSHFSSHSGPRTRSSERLASRRVTAIWRSVGGSFRDAADG